MSVREHITGVGHVGIPTNDLEGTIAYYEKLGFECEGIYPNGEDRCMFLHLNNLTLEVWTMDQPANATGAINHFALDVTDIDKAFEEAEKLGLNFVEGSVQHIDTLQRARPEPRDHRILPSAIRHSGRHGGRNTYHP